MTAPQSNIAKWDLTENISVVATMLGIHKNLKLRSIMIALWLSCFMKKKSHLFVEVKYILYSCNMWLICSCIMMAEAFVEHYIAYKVRRTTEWLTFSPGEENDYHALDTI